MVPFSFCKKQWRGDNALFKSVYLANIHGRLLGVLQYVCNFQSVKFLFLTTVHSRGSLKLFALQRLAGG